MTIRWTAVAPLAPLRSRFLAPYLVMGGLAVPAFAPWSASAQVPGEIAVLMHFDLKPTWTPDVKETEHAAGGRIVLDPSMEARFESGASLECAFGVPPAAWGGRVRLSRSGTDVIARVAAFLGRDDLGEGTWKAKSWAELDAYFSSSHLPGSEVDDSTILVGPEVRNPDSWRGVPAKLPRVEVGSAAPVETSTLVEDDTTYTFTPLRCAFID